MSRMGAGRIRKEAYAMPSLEAMKDEMDREDPKFRSLNEQHQALKRQLESLYQNSLLSQDDEVEIKRIKLEKLRLKDAMMMRLKEHEAAVHA